MSFPLEVGNFACLRYLKVEKFRPFPPCLEKNPEPEVSEWTEQLSKYFRDPDAGCNMKRLLMHSIEPFLRVLAEDSTGKVPTENQMVTRSHTSGYSSTKHTKKCRL